MANNYATHLVLGHGPMHDERESQQHPREVGCFENKQAQETEHGIGILAAPNVDEGAGKGGAEKGHGEDGRDAEEHRGSKSKQPREVGGGAAGGFFEES